MSFVNLPVLRLFSQRSSQHIVNNKRFLYILSNPDPEACDSKLNNISQVIQNLSASVIGGPTSYNPEEYKRRRQELLKYVPNSQNDLPNRQVQFKKG